MTHCVTVTGPDADELGPMIVEDVPESMSLLVRLASELER